MNSSATLSMVVVAAVATFLVRVVAVVDVAIAIVPPNLPFLQFLPMGLLAVVVVVVHRPFFAAAAAAAAVVVGTDVEIQMDPSW